MQTLLGLVALVLLALPIAAWLIWPETLRARGEEGER